MAESILDKYDAMQAQLGLDTITYTAGRARNTPYSIDDSLQVDEQVLTADRFRVGRGGTLNDTLYSSTVDRGA